MKLSFNILQVANYADINQEKFFDFLSENVDYIFPGDAQPNKEFILNYLNSVACSSTAARDLYDRLSTAKSTPLTHLIILDFAIKELSKFGVTVSDQHRSRAMDSFDPHYHRNSIPPFKPYQTCNWNDDATGSSHTPMPALISPSGLEQPPQLATRQPTAFQISFTADIKYLWESGDTLGKVKQKLEEYRGALIGASEYNHLCAVREPIRDEERKIKECQTQLLTRILHLASHIGVNSISYNLETRLYDIISETLEIYKCFSLNKLLDLETRLVLLPLLEALGLHEMFLKAGNNYELYRQSIESVKPAVAKDQGALAERTVNDKAAVLEQKYMPLTADVQPPFEQAFTAAVKTLPESIILKIQATLKAYRCELADEKEVVLSGRIKKDGQVQLLTLILDLVRDVASGCMMLNDLERALNYIKRQALALYEDFTFLTLEELLRIKTGQVLEPLLQHLGLTVVGNQIIHTTSMTTYAAPVASVQPRNSLQPAAVSALEQTTVSPTPAMGSSKADASTGVPRFCRKKSDDPVNLGSKKGLLTK